MRHSLIAPLLIGLAAATALSACATTHPTEGSYAERTEKLAAECQARGGILASTGAQTGQPQTENFCKITAGASRLPPQS